MKTDMIASFGILNTIKILRTILSSLLQLLLWKLRDPLRRQPKKKNLKIQVKHLKAQMVSATPKNQLNHYIRTSKGTVSIVSMESQWEGDKMKLFVQNFNIWLGMIKNLNFLFLAIQQNNIYSAGFTSNNWREKTLKKRTTILKINANVQWVE